MFYPQQESLTYDIRFQAFYNTNRGGDNDEKRSDKST